MRRFASEIIKNLEMRIARLERQSGRIGKIEVDEELRKNLRQNNTDGFLMAEEGDLVGVHLNKNKFPFFNIKHPRYPKKHTGIYQKKRSLNTWIVCNHFFPKRLFIVYL